VSAQLEAARAVYDELCDDLVGLLPTLDEAALNWAPLGDQTNSIAAIVRHVAGSMDSWLSRAVGETVTRDREAEFAYRGGAPDLLALVERSRAETRRRLERLATMDLTRTVRYRRTGASEEIELSLAWCVEHALIHAGEHWGQIQLTAQLHTGLS
jgi:uncharacterized damage-inducible protein DinB